MIPMPPIIALLFSIFTGFVASGCSDKENSNHSLSLNPISHVEKKAGLEISGLVKSKRHGDVYWAINDSGNPPAIVPINTKGKVVSVSGQSISIPGVQNKDWEALAIDHSGNLYICDVGNNYSRRKELQIYTIPEPHLNGDVSEKADLIRIRYPDQELVSPDRLIYDCEAAFIFKKKLYLLTKRLFDASTTLYRLDRKEKNTVNNLTRVTSFPIEGYVTAADISDDEQILVVLTYKSLWIFYDFPGDDFFSGRKMKVGLKGAGQIESVVFTDNNKLLLVNETKNELFTITLNIQ